MTLNRRIVLAHRPSGRISPKDLRLETVEVAALTEPEFVLVKNLFVSLDPATRGWMDDKKSYMKPIEVGEVIRSGAIGEVTASNSEQYEVGDLVIGLFGWEEVSEIHESQIGRKTTQLHGLPLSYELSGLGGNGLTAYFGMNRIGCPQPGETVVVSAAAGGVGSIAGQLAKLAGCRVIGIVGSDEKCEFVTGTLGFDDAINRKDGTLARQLKDTCPRGVDVYFDNVGGDILDTVLRHLSVHARVVLCGAISQINETAPPRGLSNYLQLLAKRASMEGFVTMDFASEWSDASDVLAELVKDEKLLVVEEIVEGIEQIPEAFGRLFTGEKLGKLTVKV